MIRQISKLIQELRQARKQQKMSQHELSQTIGIPQSHLSNIENGNVDIKASTLISMVWGLNMELIIIPKRLLPAVNALKQPNLSTDEPPPMYQLDDKESDDA